MDLAGRVQAFAERHGLWTSATPVVAAVSGGADSVALLLVLHQLARQALVRLAGVAHLHHHIRGEAADGDAAFVRSLAERLALPLYLHEEDVPARAVRHRQSVEVASRQARLEFFERLAARVEEPRIALAHTRTDQAETVLLRLARGAGPRGLAGMSPRNAHRVRPLLGEGRSVLREWLTKHGEPWREDATNADTSIVRNLVRIEVMPRLTALNPGVEAALARTACIQAEDASLLDELAARESERLLRAEGGAVQFSMGELRRLHDALARRVLRLGFLRVDPGRTPGWDDTEAVLRLTGSRLEFGAVQLELFGDLAVLSSRDRAARPVGPTLAAVELPLKVPGSARHPSGWWTVEAAGPLPPTEAFFRTVGASGKRFPPNVGTPPTAEAARAVVDAGAVGRHLTIRGWRPGDWVQPLGLGGRKKLQDVFVDRKVPRDERVRVPIVADATGRIVWVAGHVIGEPFRVTPHSEAVVVLTLRR